MNIQPEIPKLFENLPVLIEFYCCTIDFTTRIDSLAASGADFRKAQGPKQDTRNNLGGCPAFPAERIGGTQRPKAALPYESSRAAHSAPPRRAIYSGSRRSGLSSSSMLTSLNVITRTCLTKRAGRYMSHTQESDIRNSK